MGRRRLLALAAAGGLLLAATGAAGAGPEDLLRDLLRAQSAAERSLCGTVREALGQGFGEGDVVHTAIGLGYSPCEAVRCAVEAGGDLAAILEAAAGAGARPEVAARCAVESGADPAAVAAILNEVSRDPSYCYFEPSLRGGPPVLPPYGDADRRYRRPEFSPFVP